MEKEVIAAHKMAAFCRKKLGLANVKIMFVDPEELPGARGVFEKKDPYVVKIRKGMDLLNTMKTTAHELYHVRQFAYGDDIEFYDMGEEGAERFAEWAINNYKDDDRTFLEHLTGKDFEGDPEALDVVRPWQLALIIANHIQGLNTEIMDKAGDKSISLKELKAMEERRETHKARLEVYLDLERGSRASTPPLSGKF